MLYELPMVFTSDGAPLAGTLVRNSASLSARQRCVVITGSWLNVKEQMALVDARKWKEPQELLYRNRNSEKRRNENEEK
jgi:hypothetical protein